MAQVIAINTEVVGSINKDAQTLIATIRGDLDSLDKKVMDLTEGGGWKGDAADKFMNTYADMRNKITTEFPDVLDQLNDNLKKNLDNLTNADLAGA
jgi:WXG100 family type VII secretion target